MKLFSINSANDRKNINFDGKRINKNAIKQLTRNNPFSLTEPNQRLISNAIEEMSKVKGVNNIKFLLDSAAKVTYSTNIQNDIPAKNDWRGKLVSAALSAIAITPFVPKELKQKATELLAPKELTETEKEIVNLGEQLLAVVDLEQINNETNGPIKDFKKNLNYFIVSSETTLEHKKYVLERLNYFMSDDYEINTQLKNKKSIAVAEMINDMVISVPGNKIPNIKAVDQKFHGMCGVISMVRKKLVYEDKPKYVDSIISELDNTDYISVYDRNHLGTGKKVNVAKVPVDFDAALRLGYRIIDASTLHWMQIASMGGASNIAYEEYYPFDKESFDVRADRFFNTKIANENIQHKHAYYQALNKAKSVIEDYIASEIKFKLNKNKAYVDKNKSYKFQNKVYTEIQRELMSISGVFNQNNSKEIIANIMKLEKSKSKEIKDNKFAYIANEEFAHKKEKVKSFLAQYTKDEISDEKVKNLMGLISFYKHGSSKGISSSSPLAKYMKAEKLYEIAAAFRHQITRALEIDENIDIQILDMGLPVKETFITETIDTLIKNLENNSQYSEKIINQISENFEVNNDTESVLNTLEELKSEINAILNFEIDEIYKSLVLGSKETVLYNNIKTSLNEIKNKNSDIANSVASVLGIKPNYKKLINILERDLKELQQNKTHDIYQKLLLKYGYASEVSLLEEVFKTMINAMAIGVDEEFVEEFSTINNINIEENPNAFTEKLEELQNKIKSIKLCIKSITEALNVKDTDGEILFSADPKNVIIKELEYSYTIPDYKSMKELQAHKERVDKIWGKNEFGIKKDFKKDKTLFNLTKREIATLKLIEKNINSMYKAIQKELPLVRKNIKGPLEELAQIIGLNQGQYWVDDDQGGVDTAKMIRAIEYLTGRPHYSTTDYKKAVEKIKTTPYSGITSSFVYHNKGGMHALYVADIEPVKVKIKDQNGNEKFVEKDILFQDNTWGVREKNNTWVDSQGLTRTDYSAFQGGTLGYITNSDYRNGNFVDRISDEMLLEIEPNYVESKAYRKIKPYHPSNYIKRQYDDIIIDGKSPELKILAADIHDTLFSYNTKQLKSLEKIATLSTEEELQAKITSLKGYDSSWKSKYKELETRLLGNILNNPISTREEYEKLADDDYLKVALEKVALSENYSTIGMLADIVKVKNVQDLEKFKTTQKRRAINAFKYSFAKSPKIVEFLAKEFNEEKGKGISDILEKHNIKLSPKEENLLFPDFVIETELFNGSAKRTIGLIMQEISKSIDKVIKNETIANEIKDYYRNFLNDTLYFNAKNLEEKDELNIGRLVEFIDRVFEPESDEEFIQIYRKIQNMTIKEFNEKVLPKATYKDMGLKQLDGFDILKKFQIYDENIKDSLKNTVAADALATELNLKKYSPEYVHKQLTKFAKVGRSEDFRYCYNEINNTLSILTLEKLFNKYKDSGIRRGSFPAYPKTDVLSENLFNSSFENTMNVLEGNVHKIKGLSEQIENYEISHKLNKYINKLKPEDIPSEYQYKKINNLLGRFITLNANDPSVAELLEDAETVLEFERSTSWENYLPHITNIVNILSDFERTTSKEELQFVINNLKIELDNHQKVFAESLVQKKYQNRISEDIKNLRQALVKDNREEIQYFKDKFYNDFVKAHILQNPKELLDSYLKSLTKDSKNKDYISIYKPLLERGLAFAKLAEIQELLMGAIKDASAINIKSVFDDINVVLNIGEYKMSSDEVIFVMVNSLMLDNDNDTALLFMEKLGLGEQYVRYVINNIKTDSMKDIVDNAHKIVMNWTDFTKSLTPFSDKVSELLKENTDDFENILNKYKKQLRKLATAHNIDKTNISTLLSAIDSMKAAHITSPDSKQLFIFQTILKEVLEHLAQTIKTTVASMNSILESNSKIINIANGVFLPADSEINLQRDEFNKKFEELFNYSKALNLQAEEDSDKI